ncbi:MAG: DCC1-like thiol-disulfide oxidoreductase family protein [Actinomycetota bacterium]|nr:DCC1-like thiol-disulfide oxidoreductase family protein [Actinomycetota bacterium]
MSGERPIVLYDRDCGFCRWSLSKLLAWDHRGRLRPVALQDPEAERLLAGMSEQERMASWHLVGPGGGIRSAGAAFAPMLRELPGGAVPARLAERLPGPVDRAYRWVAGHRSPIGKGLPESAKRRADRRLASRA